MLTSIGTLGPQLVAMLGEIIESFEMVPCWGKCVTRRELRGFITSPCFWVPLCFVLAAEDATSKLPVPVMYYYASLPSWTLPLEPEAKINSSSHQSLLAVVCSAAT